MRLMRGSRSRTSVADDSSMRWIRNEPMTAAPEVFNGCSFEPLGLSSSSARATPWSCRKVLSRVFLQAGPHSAPRRTASHLRAPYSEGPATAERLRPAAAVRRVHDGLHGAGLWRARQHGDRGHSPARPVDRRRDRYRDRPVPGPDPTRLPLVLRRLACRPGSGDRVL